MKNKLLRGLLMMSAAAAFTIAAPANEADAATIDESAVTIDYEKQILTIDVPEITYNNVSAESETEAKKAHPVGSETDLQISYGVATYKAAKGTNPAKLTAPKAWDVSDVDCNYKVSPVVEGSFYDISIDPAPVQIDISTLKNTVDNCIQIKGSLNEEPLTIMIPKINSKVNGVFNPISSTVTVNDISAGKNNAVAQDDVSIQYRTAYSNWMEYNPENEENGTREKTKLNLYQPKGATLYFRIAPEEETLTLSSITESENIVDAKNAELTYTVKKVAAFPGKEIKVAVAKLANAPKISVDYLKQTFTFPKNTEYRINTVDGIGEEWIAAPTDGAEKPKVVPLNAAEFNSEAGTVELRTVETVNETNPAKSKAASKVAQLPFDAKADAPTVTCGDENRSEADAILAYDVTANKIIDSDSKEVAATYVEGTRSNTLSIINGTADTYEVYVKAAPDEATVSDTVDLPEATVKVTVVKPGKTVKISKASDDAKKKVEKGATVFIRKAGNKKDAVWSTDFVGLGTVGGETNSTGDTTTDDTTTDDTTTDDTTIK